MSTERYVIIGNGVAANRAAVVLREGDPEARISLISDEFFPFYHRYRLRELALGRVQEQELPVQDPEEYKRRRIRLRLGQRVIRLDLEERTLYLEHREKVRYSKLLICSGSRPRIPEELDRCGSLLTVLKTLEDARRLRKKLKEVSSILMVGGDMVSLKMAAGFLEEGKQVTFLVDRDSFWPLSLTEEQRCELAGSLESRGARVIRGDRLVGAKEGEKGILARTREGLELPCDLLGAFFGYVPDVEFLMKSGLDIERGILVDPHLRTSDPAVWAAGDCAQVYNPSIRNYWVSIGWPNAGRLGECAARNILGESRSAEEPPQDVLATEGIRVQTGWWKEY